MSTPRGRAPGGGTHGTPGSISSLANRIERREAERVAATLMSECTTTAFVAVNNAPLIGEPAATRGRSATEGGAEHAGAKRALSVRAPASRTGSNAGNLDQPKPVAAGKKRARNAWKSHRSLCKLRHHLCSQMRRLISAPLSTPPVLTSSAEKPRLNSTLCPSPLCWASLSVGTRVPAIAKWLRKNRRPRPPATMVMMKTAVTQEPPIHRRLPTSTRDVAKRRPIASVSLCTRYKSLSKIIGCQPTLGGRNFLRQECGELRTPLDNLLGFGIDHFKSVNGKRTS